MLLFLIHQILFKIKPSKGWKERQECYQQAADKKKVWTRPHLCGGRGASGGPASSAVLWKVPVDRLTLIFCSVLFVWLKKRHLAESPFICVAEVAYNFIFLSSRLLTEGQLFSVMVCLLTELNVEKRKQMSPKCLRVVNVKLILFIYYFKR